MKLKIFGTILALIVLSNFLAPNLIRKKLINDVQEECPSCVLAIGKITVGGLFTSLTLQDIQFVAGNPKATAVNAQIPMLKVHIVPGYMFKSIIHIKKIVVENPRVKILEGDLKSESKPSKDKKAMRFIVDEIEMVKGDFTYTRERKGRLAPIHVTQISGQIGKIGNTKELISQATTGEVKAFLESAGKIKLKVTAELFKPSVDLQVNLGLNEMPLEKMNPYFETDDGVKLSGKLIQADSEVVIKGQKLNSYVQAEYNNLEVEFKKTGERTKLAAFFTTLVAGVKMNSKNTDVKAAKQIQHVEIQREHNETIISFILRGMKDAALKVATAPKKK